MRISDWSSDVCSSDLAKLLLDGGFYVSAVFFPTVPRGAAGLRICLTASHAQDDIRRLCGLIDAAQAWRAFDPAAQAGGMPCRWGSCRDDGADRKSTRLNSSH